jgi:hypothetical protein
VSDLAAALQIAIKVHADQRDKQGEPYLLHVLRVVEAVSDEAKVVAALHDVFEETGDDPWKGLEQAPLNLSTTECLALALLTRNDEKTYAEYVDLIAEAAMLGDLARVVKLADLRDHLAHMPPDGSLDSLKPRYERALEVLENAS